MCMSRQRVREIVYAYIAVYHRARVCVGVFCTYMCVFLCTYVCILVYLQNPSACTQGTRTERVMAKRSRDFPSLTFVRYMLECIL